MSLPFGINAWKEIPQSLHELCGEPLQKVSLKQALEHVVTHYFELSEVEHKKLTSEDFAAIASIARWLNRNKHRK